MRVQFVDGVVCAVKEKFALSIFTGEKNTDRCLFFFSSATGQPAGTSPVDIDYNQLNLNFFVFFINSSIGSAFVSLYIIIIIIISWEEFSFVYFWAAFLL